MGNSLITETMSWDSLRRLHKITNSLASVASEIEELGPNMLDVGRISEQLQAEFGITIWKLRDICDFMYKIENREQTNARKFEDFLNGKLTREDMVLPVEYQI
jgi:hypothetical protein